MSSRKAERFQTLGEFYAADYPGYVMRLNLHRRHLSSEERKVLYLKLRELRGVREHGFNRHNLDVTKVTSTTPSQTTYASEMGVSRKTVNDWESDAKILD